MKFGLHLDNANSRDATALLSSWLAMVRTADAAGFDYVSVVDHLVPFPNHRSSDLTLFDPWQLLATFAGITSKVTLLTLVTNAPNTHPARLAKQVATLDVISEGRTMVGLGAGGYQADDAAISSGARAFQVRYEQLAECIDVLELLWHGKETTTHGPYYPVGELVSAPQPQARPRLLIAGKSKPILRLVADKASASNFAFTNLSDLKLLMQRLTEILASAARPLTEIEITVLDRVFIGDSDSQAQQAWQSAGAPAVYGHPGLVGAADSLVQSISQLEAAGVNTLFLMFNDSGSLQQFSQEVLPRC
ncbi:MAG: LLM class flavin-dependent oxidoreductase [Pseudomonadales bacterium]